MAPQAKKKIGYGVKMLVYNHSHSTNPFLRSKKGKWRRRQKKNKGYGTSASAASESFKVPSFQSSGRSGGPRARGPQKCPKIPSFFFFFIPLGNKVYEGFGTFSGILFNDNFTLNFGTCRQGVRYRHRFFLIVAKCQKPRNFRFFTSA